MQHCNVDSIEIVKAKSLQVLRNSMTLSLLGATQVTADGANEKYRKKWIDLKFRVNINHRLRLRLEG